MANTPIFASGFEVGVQTSSFGYDSVTTSGTFGLVNSALHNGSYHLQVNPTTTNAGYVMFGKPTSTTAILGGINSAGDVYANFYFKPATLPASVREIIAGFYTGTAVTTAVSTLTIDSGGHLILRDSAGTNLFTGTTVLNNSTVYRIGYYNNRTTGAWEVRINGATEASGTGASLGATNIGNLSLGKVANLNGNTVDFRYDDVWLDSGGFAPGDYVVALDKPTANGTTMSWTGGTAPSDYTQVNAIPAQTAATNYVEDLAGTTVPVIAQFAMQTFAQMGLTAGGTVQAVFPMVAVLDKVNLTNTFKFGLISNSVKSLNSTAKNTSTTMTPFALAILTDPNTSAAWTQSGVENMQFYAEEGTSAVDTAMPTALMYVLYVTPVTATEDAQASELMLLGCG